MIHLILSFDMILFAIHSVMMICILSHWYEILFCWYALIDYAIVALLWLWIALLCFTLLVLFCCPSFCIYIPSHGGTMAMSLRHQWHDTFCGGVIDPRRPLLFCYDICAHWPLWYVYMPVMSRCIYMICFAGGIWMHPRFCYVLFWIWLVIGWCVPCTPSLLGASYSIWYLRGLPSLYNL